MGPLIKKWILDLQSDFPGGAAIKISGFFIPLIIGFLLVAIMPIFISFCFCAKQVETVELCGTTGLIAHKTGGMDPTPSMASGEENCLVLVPMNCADIYEDFEMPHSFLHDSDEIFLGAKRFLVPYDPGKFPCLEKNFNSTKTVKQRKLDLYLSVKTTRDGKRAVDFSICNLSRKVVFNGSVALWIAELQDVGLRQKVWFAVKKITERDIKDLAPASVTGCALPDSFPLPELSKMHKSAVFIVVYNKRAEVQAVMFDMCGE